MSATGNADVKLLFGAEKGSAGKITEDLLSILKTLDSQNIFKITIGIKDINQADITRISNKISTSVQTAVSNAISAAVTNAPAAATAALSKTASTSGSAKAVKKSVSDTTTSYTNMGKSISSASSAINSMSNRLDTFSKNLNAIPTTFKSATEAANAFATALERITGAAGGVKTAVGGIGGTRNVGSSNNTTGVVPANDVFTQGVYTKAQGSLNKVFEGEAKFNTWSAAKNSKNEVVQRAYTAIKNDYAEMHSLQGVLNNKVIGESGGVAEFNQRFSELEANIKNNISILKAHGVTTQSWSAKLSNMAKRLTQWFGTYQVILMIYKGLRKMVGAVADIDKAMTELKKVTDASNSTYEKFLSNATKRAKTLGATIADTVSATSDFARLGYGIEDAEKLADAAIVYKNVGDGIEDIGTASESIISTMQAFGIGANDVMSIVDKFNNVGNNFAISSKGVGDVLMRSAAALNAANNTLDESIALAAAANTVIQDPEKVGTALKTISMFLRASKTEAEEAGIETEGMANSVSELARDISRLTDGKVQIQPDKDSFKSTFQIIKELSEVWDELSETSQANITEMIGGKRNSNVISALLENFSIAEDALAESLDSEGSAMAENQKQLDSLEGRVTLFKASFQELATVLTDTDTLKFFVDFGTGIMNALTWVSKLIGLIGGLKNALGGVAMVLAVIKAEAIFTKLRNFFTGLFKPITSVIGYFKLARASGLTFTQTLSNGFKKLTASMTAVQWKMIAITAAIVAVTAIIGAYNKHLENLQENVDKGKEIADESKQLSDLIKQYNSLEKAENGRLTSASREQAVSIEEQITELIGKQADNLNLVNGKYDEQIAKLREIEGIKAGENIADMTTALSSAEDLLEKAAKGGFWADEFSHGEKWSVGVGIQHEYSEQNAVDKLLKDEGFEKYTGDGVGEFGYFMIDHSSHQAIVQSYEDMEKLRNIIATSYKEEIKEGGKLEDFYNRLTERCKDLSGAVSQYKEALANYNQTEGLNIFNNEDAAKKAGITKTKVVRNGKKQTKEEVPIVGALIKTEEELKTFLSTMVKAAGVSDELQGILFNLAEAQFPQFKGVIDEARESVALGIIKNQLLSGSFDASTTSVESLAGQCGLTTKAFGLMMLKMTQLEDTKLNLSQQIAALSNLAAAMGLAELTGDDIYANGFKFVSKNKYEKDGKYYTYNEAYRTTENDRLTTYFNGLGDGDGNGYTPPPPDKNKKNEALDNYLKAAENRYKVHQNEARYIKELQWAYDNLTKSEEERLEIMGKIDEAERDFADNNIKDLEHQIEMKKELYGDDYDATTEWTEVQRFAHEEAERLRKPLYDKNGNLVREGYDENSNEIQELQKTWWDAENDKLTWRLNNSKNWIEERNRFGDWEKIGDSEIKAWERVINWLKTEFPHAIDEIEDAEKSLFEARKKEAQDAIDDMESYIDERNMYGDWTAFADNEVSAIRRIMAYTEDARAQQLLTYEEYCDKMKGLSKNLYEALKKDATEALEHSSSQLNSLKTLTEAYYEVSNSVAEAQHEINKELEASKTMYQYLDEETRKLLFNEEDYITLTEKLNSIQYEADELQRNYNEEILGATAENLDEITSKYQMQYETMMKQYEIAKAELDIAKKRQKLDNVLNERNVRMFIGGRWQWVANTQDVIDAQKELADAEYEKQKAQTDLFQQNTLNTLTTASDKLKTVINQVESGVINLNTDVGNICNGLRNIENVALPALNRILNGAAAVIGTYTGDVGTAKTNSSASNGVTSTKNLDPGYVSWAKAQMAANSANWHTADENGKRALEKANQDLGKAIGSTFNSATGVWTHHHADGTNFTPGGLTLMGEEGNEVLITANGVAIPINRPTIGNISPGGLVFNSSQLSGIRHLWDLVQPGHMPTISSQNSSSISYDQSITINGMKVDSGSENGKALISALRRYVGNH